MQINKLGRLFKSQKRQLYLTAIAITKNRELAEDAVHDALIAVSQNSSEINNLQAYLFSVVRNKAKWMVKNNHKEFIADEFLELSHSSPENQLFASQLTKHLNSLNETQQSIIIQKIFAELTFKEIAEINNKSINTIASHYRRGLAKLKEKLL